MATISVSYLKLDSNIRIIDHNENFVKLFRLQDTSLINLPLLSVLRLEEKSLVNYMHKLNPGEQKSVIIFHNNKTTPQSPENNSILILYCLISKHKGDFIFRIINLLNWVHGLTNSMENAYTIISKFNDNMDNSKFSKISDASCYKALYPLASYTPRKFSNTINRVSLFEIMRVFIRQRSGTAKYSRCYFRNTQSRIKTNLKKEYNLNYVEIMDLIKNDKLLNISFNGELCMPNTLLIQDVILSVNHDVLLNSIIEVMTGEGE